MFLKIKKVNASKPATGKWENEKELDDLPQNLLYLICKTGTVNAHIETMF